MAADTVEAIRVALDRIPRIPGTGMRDYEQLLRSLAKDGTEVPPELMRAIGELADAYNES
jgi:hypothetical protein